ncbi:MAG: UDP-N-acetylmuramoyl-L-alanyl-D-glutamate--2,6-diaminopimelate ligase [Prevotellaceae bacterium]|jgi:UDP-N-acetylmuramoyl-L-alanyl-D-glutamate--2,6-diaminopimelate ligase|nr:UDP-N-acetylmuramoyl-L-alanyl-D-glutamate--2,6-diaminopimelate ligase [Prevotellaceae bacterium]
MKTIAEITDAIPVQEHIGRLDTPVCGIASDSRKAEPGFLFIATCGTQCDGHDFIPSAIDKGAKAIICEKMPEQKNPDVTYIKVKNANEALGQVASAWFDYPSSNLKLTGITGTNGKTTIATLLYQLFMRLGYKTGLLSTVCNYINEQKMQATHTTPDPISLNALLAEMVNAGCQYAFMEVSSHAVEQRRIAGLEFAGAVFTNLTRDHLDYHKTFANYLKAKKRFFDDLPNEAFALTNADDKNGLVMLQNSKAKKLTYSTRSLADFKVRILEDNFDGMLLEMNGKEIVVPFTGRFNASNLLAVLGTAVLLGQDEDEVLVNLSALHSVSGRFEVLHAPAGYKAIVDYAHTPDALQNVINTINEIREGSGKLITVVGCGGNRDKGKRPLMARETVNGSCQAIFTSDNPRNEDPQAIINDMLDGLDVIQKRKVIAIPDRYQAIKTGCMLAQPGDIILVAGKGHEDYQEINGVKHHFDDKEVLKSVMNDKVN